MEAIGDERLIKPENIRLKDAAPLMGDPEAADANQESKLGTSILRTLATLGRRGCSSDTKAVIAPEEECRVPMLQRGVSLAFLRSMRDELKELGRSDYDSGQFLNGGHTTNSATDWKEFNRSLDEFSGKACTLHTGTSFVETCMKAGLTHDRHGKAFFGKMNT